MKSELLLAQTSAKLPLGKGTGLASDQGMSATTTPQLLTLRHEDDRSRRSLVAAKLVKGSDSPNASIHPEQTAGSVEALLRVYASLVHEIEE
jgi:hypothetical protein